MAVSIQQLIRDKPPLVSIAPSASLKDAVARMIEHDYTQLAVEENGRPYGKPPTIVTSNSIAHALLVFGTSLHELRVRDAVVPARTVLEDDDLFSKMDDLLDAYAVLVLKPDGTLAGIVTNHDTTQYFRLRAEDTLLVEDIETTLKDHVRLAYGADDGDAESSLQAAIDTLGTPSDTIRDSSRRAFRRFCADRSIQVTDDEIKKCIDDHFASKKPARKFDDLNLSDYIQLARRDAAWKALGPVFGVPSQAFLEMLDGVRQTRNKLMHFRPDIDTLERDRLRFCAEWFKNHPPIIDEMGPGPEGSGPRPVDVPGPDAGAIEGLEYVEDPTVVDSGPSAENTVEGKYAPLAAHLAQQPRSLERLALSFEEVEEIIGARLPAAAREHRAWWANDSVAHVQSDQWLKVSWRVVSINMSLERVVFARAHDRERAYIDFFSAVQGRLRVLPDFPLHKISSTGANWLPLVRYPDHAKTLVLSFARRQRVRLECYIDAGDADENGRIFERLLDRQAVIESILEAPLEWERLEGRRACRIALYTNGSINDEGHAEELVDWAVLYAERFHRALTTALQTVEPGHAATAPNT